MLPHHGNSPRQQRLPLSISELVLSAVHAVVDGRNNLHIVNPSALPETHLPVMYWYDTRSGALHICRHVPAEYHPSHFVSYQCSKALVTGVVQPERLSRVILRNSSLLIQRNDDAVAAATTAVHGGSPFRFPVLGRLHLCASTLTMREPLDTVEASLSVGSRVLFTPGATCNTIRLQFFDNNPGNAFSGTYYDSLYTEAGGFGHIDVVRLPRPNRRRSTSPVGAYHWTRRIPVRPCGEPDAATENVCALCRENLATWFFTSCRHPSICSGCVETAITNKFISERRCPYCRASGAPTPN